MVICKYGVIREYFLGKPEMPTGQILVWDKIHHRDDLDTVWEVGSRLPGGLDVNIFLCMMDEGVEVDAIVMPDLPDDLVQAYRAGEIDLDIFDEITGERIKVPRPERPAECYQSN